MLARLARDLPAGDWCFEPKWDGFRCILFRAADQVVLQSRNERPLTRYFPEVVAAARELPHDAVVDGELLLDRRDDFPNLLARIHPAASRVALLAEQHPAHFVAFDCLAVDDSDLMRDGFERRRRKLSRVVRATDHRIVLTPITRSRTDAEQWLAKPQPGWDGVVAKAPATPYEPGRRTMVKVKQERTADCVVAGVRIRPTGAVSSLLLGLWRPDGVLHHPGVVTSPPGAVKEELTLLLPQLAVSLAAHPWRDGFGLEGGPTGRLKGAGSRWLPDMTLDWVPVAPRLVAEVAYDRLDGLRFRHPARFRHWRPDRDAASCSIEQLTAGR
jgi:ATP-dependent DNA ligase